LKTILEVGGSDNADANKNLALLYFEMGKKYQQ
jgi:hypothetical protein